ncbi:MAG: hypothetical protein HQ523_13805 [Lentisphaerae bacterium]|nr:hypothetical protein [Lentisphaerota bacterium]
MESFYAESEHLPLLFWACGLLVLILAAYAFHQNRSSWALPCLSVLGTTAVWYLGDILYSGIDHIDKVFPQSVIDRALWQVMLFLITYVLLCREVTRWFVRDREDHTSLFDQPDLFGNEKSQNEIAKMLWFTGLSWAIVVLIGLFRNGFPVVEVFAPYLAGRDVNMWGRERLGGAGDFLISTGYFIHIFLSAVFGGILVLSRTLRLRMVTVIMILLAWPYWLFAYGRNVVLVLGIPATCGYFIFSRQRLAYRVAVAVMAFMAVNVWFKFTLATRHSIGAAAALTQIIEGETSAEFVTKTRHLGLDMFKELCYMNHYIENGKHSVNWGQGYFSEIVNFVPRSWWPGKPTVGIEFSIARGSQTRGMGSELVTSLITPGMIGQGVENFGTVLGPITAAFLMAVWTGILSLFWTQRRSALRACLFLIGLGLTFNTGRVITLQVFFPFVFGYLMARVYERYERRQGVIRAPQGR